MGQIVAQLGMGSKPWNYRTTVADYEKYELVCLRLFLVHNGRCDWFVILTVELYIEFGLRSGVMLGESLNLVVLSSNLHRKFQTPDRNVYRLSTHHIKPCSCPSSILVFRRVHCAWKYITLPEDQFHTLCTIYYNDFPYWFFLSIFTVFLDIFVSAIPSRPVWKLQMGRRQKIVVVLLIGAGGLYDNQTLVKLHQLTWIPASPWWACYDLCICTVAIGSARDHCPPTSKWTCSGKENPYHPPLSLTHHFHSTFEINQAVICACLPTLKNSRNASFPACSAHQLPRTIGAINILSFARQSSKNNQIKWWRMSLRISRLATEKAIGAISMRML